MIKEGQIYREKRVPRWRKNGPDLYVVTKAEYSVWVIYNDGFTDSVGRAWVEEDCDLVAEYPTWQEAVNAPEFKRGER